MMAVGCKRLRFCHSNNSAAGIATQDNVLRLKYLKSQVEMVMH